MMRRAGHIYMIVAVELVDFNIRMSYEPHHPPHIEILLISTIQLLLRVSGNYYIWGTILAHVERGAAESM